MHQASHLELLAAGLIYRYGTTVSIQRATYSDSGVISGNSESLIPSGHSFVQAASVALSERWPSRLVATAEAEDRLNNSPARAFESIIN
jgi:hypothetical protein